MINTIRDADCSPPHPGEILREDVLSRLRLAPATLAARLDLPPESIVEVLAERRPVTIEIATRLSAVFGHSIRFWLGLQAQYDRWQLAAPASAA